jgi:hypothetical protein
MMFFELLGKNVKLILKIKVFLGKMSNILDLFEKYTFKTNVKMYLKVILK